MKLSTKLKKLAFLVYSYGLSSNMIREIYKEFEKRHINFEEWVVSQGLSSPELFKLLDELDPTPDNRQIPFIIKQVLDGLINLTDPKQLEEIRKEFEQAEISRKRPLSYAASLKLAKTLDHDTFKEFLLRNKDKLVPVIKEQGVYAAQLPKDAEVSTLENPREVAPAGAIITVGAKGDMWPQTQENLLRKYWRVERDSTYSLKEVIDRIGEKAKQFNPKNLETVGNLQYGFFLPKETPETIVYTMKIDELPEDHDKFEVKTPWGNLIGERGEHWVIIQAKAGTPNFDDYYPVIDDKGKPQGYRFYKG